jgi:hypothetical protein
MVTNLNLQLTYTTGEDGFKQLHIPEDQRERAIAFVREAGAKTAAEIEAIVQDGHDALLATTDGVSESQAAWKPAPDQWCINDVMAHCVSVKRAMALLSQHLGKGELPPGFGPQFEEARAQDGFILQPFTSLAAAREAANEAHAALLAQIRTLDDPALNTEKTFRHFYFGAFNAREWPVFQRVHDGDHWPHIEKIRATAGYPAA